MLSMKMRSIYPVCIGIYIISIGLFCFKSEVACGLVGINSGVLQFGTSNYETWQSMLYAQKLGVIISQTFTVICLSMMIISYYYWKYGKFAPKFLAQLLFVVSFICSSLLIMAHAMSFIAPGQII